MGLVKSRPLGGFVAVMLALAALSGCSTTTAGQGAPGISQVPSPQSGPTAFPSGGAQTSRTPAEYGAELEQIALQNGDFANGFHLKLIPHGDQVQGQVTLDNCGFDFTTEAHRVARRQYALVDSKSRGAGLSNELVAYDSPREAAKALAQWEDAAAHCPRTPVASTVAGVPKMVERILRNHRDLPSLLVRTNALTAESYSVRGHGTLYGITVVQVHGVLLDNIYLELNKPPTTQDIRVALREANITGQRLAEAS